MKIFIQDRGWRGAIIVVANDEKEAREMMKEEENYNPESGVDVYDIQPGHVHTTLGDI